MINLTTTATSTWPARARPRLGVQCSSCRSTQQVTRPQHAQIRLGTEVSVKGTPFRLHHAAYDRLPDRHVTAPDTPWPIPPAAPAQGMTTIGPEPQTPATTGPDGLNLAAASWDPASAVS